jgi:maleylacetoacetate isomerase
VALTLYTYFRSSAAYRVRIALALKGLRYEPRFVHLRRGEQRQADYLALNPQGIVPTLIDNGRALTQSLAIIEYLDELHPEPPLLPRAPAARAFVRAMALAIACDMHPVNNLGVLKYLEQELHQDEAARQRWYRHWVAKGFGAIETQLAAYDGRGRCCHGDTPTLADICLVPQVFNARRYGCDVSAYPTVMAIADHCAALPAFRAAAPENQADAE